MKRLRMLMLGMLMLGIPTLGMLVVLTSELWWESGERTPRLEGAGSTFADPMMSHWASVYNKQNNIEVNYQPKGSGAGIRMMTGREVDFGCSDAPLDDDQIAKAKSEGGDVVHIPLCMGAIVPIFNLPGISDLTFSGQVLRDIYLGKIKKWNDPALKKLNPDVDLPDKEIAVVHRSEGSGTTYIWTDYLTKVSPEWKKKVGVGTSVNWPTGIGQKGNEGVSGQVRRSLGSIGYVELIYAMKEHISYGKMINKSGKAIKADMESVTAAAAGTDFPPDLRYSITNSKGEQAYPIAGTVWALVYVKQPAQKAQKLKEFLTWVTHDGQKECEKLHYAPLPPVLVKKIEAKLAKIQAGK